MFEMMLMRGGFNPHMGKIGLYNLNYVAGPTTDELYLFGGITEDELQNSGLWLWNGKTDTYTNLGLVPTTVHKGGAASVGTVGGDLYCINGEVIDVYRVGTKRWEKRSLPVYGSPYNFMSNGSVTYGGYIYFFGPSTSPAGITLKRYDHVTNGWTTESTYKTTTNSGGYNRGIVLGNVAYFMGGSLLNTTVMKYNFTSKVWKTITSPVAILARPALSVYANKILITPVDEPGQPFYSSTGKRIMMLDPATDTFTQIAETNPPKLTAATVVVGNQLKAFGGQDKATGKPLATVQSIAIGPPAHNYDNIPITKTVAITAADQPVRAIITCNDVAKGRIWIYRGIQNVGSAWSTWIGYYDVAAGTWVKRYNWTASPLLAASMVVQDDIVYFFKQSEIYTYNNNTNTFTKLAVPGGYVFTEYAPPATVYKGEIYLMGGSEAAGTYYCEVVKYNPVNNSKTSVFKQQVTPYPHGSSPAGVLVGDWFCIVGSNNSGGSDRLAYCYNLATGAFKSIPLAGTVGGNGPMAVSDGKTFTILGGISTGAGNLLTVDPNTGFTWLNGVIAPPKQLGGAILLNDEVTYYGGSSSSQTSQSPTVITFKYPTSGS